MLGKMIPEASKPGMGDDGSYRNEIQVAGEIKDALYDETEFFNKEVRPVLEKLLQTCSSRGIPLMVQLAHCNTEENGRGVCFVGIMPGARTPLSFRLIADMMNDKTGLAVKACATALALFHAASDNNNPNKETKENE